MTKLKKENYKIIKIPRLVVAGVSSGSGKTTVATELICALKNKGYKVKPFKIGPDYIDTGYLSYVSGEDALNLDFWLMGKENILQSLIKNISNLNSEEFLEFTV